MPTNTASYDRTALLNELQFVFQMDQFGKHLSELICGTGILINGLLILIIPMRTPPHLKSYAILLFNFAFFDFLTCLTSLFACQKTIFSGLSLTYVFHGPCKHIAAWLCYFFHCFVCHAMAHSQWILLISFIYRYVILVSRAPSTRSLILISISIYSLSFITFFLYFLDRGDSDELLLIMSNLHPTYHYEDQTIWGELVVSGNTTILTTYSLLAIFYMTFPCLPIYIAILHFRKKTLIILDDVSLNMSETSKTSHTKLIQALTIQAMIPCFWLIASSIFTLAEFGVISGPIPENITFRLMDFIPATTPIVSFVYIAPYRDGISALFIKSGIVKSTRQTSTIIEVSAEAAGGQPKKRRKAENFSQLFDERQWPNSTTKLQISA